MQLRTQLSPPLNQFVNCLWYSDGETRPHRKERLLPTGSVDVIIKLREDRRVRIFNKAEEASAKSVGSVVVSGAYNRPYAIDTAQPSPTLGIHFRPGGAAPFFAVPLCELMNLHTGLDELWGPQSSEFRERLMGAKSVGSMFDIVEQTLFRRVTIPPTEFPGVLQAVRTFANTSSARIKAVSESMGYRSKRFIRLFHDAVGLTPKMFCRIQRFQSVLDQITTGIPFEWVEVALANGYYDQSHLIRDFRTFAGVTPLEYKPAAAGRKNHMAMKS